MHTLRRMALQRAAGLVVALAAAVLSGCATAPPPTAGANPHLLQQMDATLRGASAQIPLALRISPDQVATGSPLRLHVSSSAPGYVYVFQLTTDGRTLDGVFPNAIDGANRLGAGQDLQLPRPTWRMVARGPAGVGYILAVLTEAPQDLLALRAGLAAGRIDLAGRYGAAMGSIREAAR
jgi:hypothetical protein